MFAAPTPAELQLLKRDLTEAWERESATTLKLLRAYPADQSELRPQTSIKSARELAWMFTLEQLLTAAAIRDQLDLSKGMTPAPATLDEVIQTFERSRSELLELLRTCTDEQLAGTVKFMTGPRQMGDWPKIRFVQFILNDQIHHRGQFSVYLRMAGGKLPSIYGPTADEPWH